MESQPNPSALEALEMLAEIHPQIHQALDHGAFKATAYFEAEDTKVEKSLQSMLVRYHGKLHLQETFPDDIEFDNLSLCGLSLLCKNLRWKGKPINCRLRIWKAFNNELPPPASNDDGKVAFYTQPQFELFTDGADPREDDPTPDEIKLAVLWNLNSKGQLQPMWLVAPKRFNRRTGEITIYWDIRIPDPALAVAEQPASDKVEDLPLKSKKPQENK